MWPSCCHAMLRLAFAKNQQTEKEPETVAAVKRKHVMLPFETFQRNCLFSKLWKVIIEFAWFKWREVIRMRGNIDTGCDRFSCAVN